MSSKRNLVLSWKLYGILDKRLLGRRDPVRLVSLLFKKKLAVIQLRFKHLPSYEFARFAKGIRQIAAKYNRTLLINDRIDVALASKSGGVHLGEGDMPPKTARALLGRKCIIGKTVHSLSEARHARRQDLDYASCGPIFATPLKRHLAGQGINFISKIKRETGLPVLAVGGINERNVKAVFKGGADGVCAARAISKTKLILDKINQARKAGHSS